MLKYRKDIDGLRGVAILSAILYHFSVPGFHGGFIGVDIFFVISGYLIGSIILEGLKKDKFSFTTFYERRVRRILPALYTVIVTCLLFSFLFLDSAFFKELGKTAVATILFISNLLFYNNTTNYFAKESGGDILLHTWSLSIEEQFYIFFPLFIFLVNKYAKKYILHFIVFLFAVSLALSIYLSKDHPVASFYLPFTRIWELMAGVFIAKLKSSDIKKGTKELLSFLGTALLIIGYIKLNKTSVFPGYNALFPVAGVAMIIYFGSNESLVISRLLSFRPLMFTGKISYSLYLWHWPVKIFAGYFFIEPLSKENIILLLSITFVLSVISWRVVEQPFRWKKNPFPGSKKMFFISGFATMFLLAVSLFIHIKDGLPGRSVENKLIDEAENDSTWFNIWTNNELTRQIDSLHGLPRIGDTLAVPDFILWGDSHAGMMAAGFDAAAREKGKAGFIAVTVGDPPVLPDPGRKTNNPLLGKVNASIIQFIAEHTEIKKVFLWARWTTYRESSVTDAVQKSNDAFPLDHELLRVIAALDSLHREIIINTPIPELMMSPRKYFFQHKFFHKDINSFTTTKEYFLSRNKLTLDMLKALPKDPNVKLFTVYDILFLNGRSLLLDNGHFLYGDVHHLSHWGSLKFKDMIKEEM